MRFRRKLGDAINPDLRSDSSYDRGRGSRELCEILLDDPKDKNSWHEDACALYCLFMRFERTATALNEADYVTRQGSLLVVYHLVCSFFLPQGEEGWKQCKVLRHDDDNDCVRQLVFSRPI